MSAILRRAIEQSGQSLYRISAGTGLNKSALSRFVAGKRSLRLDLADKLALHFHLELKGTVTRGKFIKRGRA